MALFIWSLDQTLRRMCSVLGCVTSLNCATQHTFLRLLWNAAGRNFLPIKTTKQGPRETLHHFSIERFPKGMCFSHSRKGFYLSNWVCRASCKSQAVVSQTSQSGSRLKPEQDFSKGPVMRQLYAGETVAEGWLTGFYAPYIRFWKLHLGLYTIYALLEMLFCEQNSIKSASVDFWRRRGTNEHVWCSSYSFTSA